MQTHGQTAGEKASSTTAARGAGVQSIDRAVSILRCFTGETPALGIGDLAKLTGLSTSTVHRMLAAMRSNDLVRQTQDRRYALGPLVLQLAHAGAVPSTLRAAALPLARELRDEVNETVGIHEHVSFGQRIVIDQVESRQELRRTYTELGQPIPVLYGSPGKAIMAFLPTVERERLLAGPVSAMTSRTITDPNHLRSDLAKVRARGWAYSDAERTPGIRSIAAPILDHSGAVVGAIGLSMPAVRVPDERVPVLGERVRRLGREVSAALGASQDTYTETARLASAALP